MKNPYIVTDKAGFEVAGIRNPGAGAVIYLTDRQAEHPLRIREIARPPAVASEPELSIKEDATAILDAPAEAKAPKGESK